MNRFNFIALGLGLLGLTCPAAGAAEDSPVYELRTYTTNEGKLEALLARFRDHTCRLFEKHGIENVGYWVPVEKADGADNTLIYVVAHKSREGAKASWAKFAADPDWKVARAASEAGGKILAKAPEVIFMKATQYSPPVKLGAEAKERVFEMRTYTTPEGKLEALHRRFTDHTKRLFERHGMTNVVYWTPMDADKGSGNTLIYLLAHPSKGAGLAAFTAFRLDPEWTTAKAASERNGSLTLPQPNGVKSVYVRATDFSPLR